MDKAVWSFVIQAFMAIKPVNNHLNIYCSFYGILESSKPCQWGGQIVNLGHLHEISYAQKKLGIFKQTCSELWSQLPWRTKSQNYSGKNTTKKLVKELIFEVSGEKFQFHVC